MEWAVFMLILLAFTVAIILAVGGKAQTMWENIQTLLTAVITQTDGQPKP